VSAAGRNGAVMNSPYAVRSMKTDASRSGAALRTRLPGIGFAVALHAVALVGLLQYEPARQAIAAAAPIMVSLVAPPQIQPPIESPKPLPSKPQMKARPQPKPVVAPPIVTAPSEAPSQFIAPPPPPVSLPPIEAAPPPPPAPAAVAEPPVIPPRFNAAYLQNPVPPYPALARRRGEQGKVLMRVLVNAQGLADKVELRTSSGFARLDQTALETVKQWKFIPARQGDSPVAAWVLVPISFSLEG
jgi:protein TonB